MRQGMRGKNLERLVDMTNLQYRRTGLADIRKIPTPVVITSKNKGKITGHLTRGELVDYMGVKDGQAVIFDAKETAYETRFPLDNIHPHQFEILKSWHHRGARAFLLVSFSKMQYETFILPFEKLEKAWEGYTGDGPKSIPYKEFVEHCEKVRGERGYVLHYLG